MELQWSFLSVIQYIVTTWKYLFWIPYSKMPVYTHACVYKTLCNWLSSTNNRSTGLCGSPLSRGLSLSLTQWWKVTWEEKLKTFVLSKQANHHPSEESFRLEGFGITGGWDNRRDLSLLPTWGSSAACPRSVITIELFIETLKNLYPGLPSSPEGRTYSLLFSEKRKSASFGSTYTKKRKKQKKGKFILKVEEI